MPTHTCNLPSDSPAPALFDASFSLAQPFGVLASSEVGDPSFRAAFVAWWLAVCRLGRGRYKVVYPTFDLLFEAMAWMRMSAAPASMARSATLKIPLRSDGPRPTFMKSTTAPPRKTRSAQLLAPPASTS